MKLHHYKFGGAFSPGLQKTWDVRAWCGRNMLNTHTTAIMRNVTCKRCKASVDRHLRDLARALRNY